MCRARVSKTERDARKRNAVNHCERCVFQKAGSWSSKLIYTTTTPSRSVSIHIDSFREPRSILGTHTLCRLHRKDRMTRRRAKWGRQCGGRGMVTNHKLV